MKIIRSLTSGLLLLLAVTTPSWAQFSGTGAWQGIGSSGAPTTAGYWVDQANATLTAERNLGALTTGLVLNTVTASVGVPSTYAGTLCTNQFPRSLNASAAATCASVSLTADITGILATANGGTGIAYFTAAGPTVARVYTFPDAAATIARTDAAQTFTGVQTLSSQPILSSLTASVPVFTDASKGLISGTQTGTGTVVVVDTSPTLAGTPLAPTAVASTSSTQIATTAFTKIGRASCRERV